ncbi:hypothetical protein PIB30_022441 [Stylosanthes scabra]|uniref:Small-subunit processome Utp12 domain-containing protein n=1 Tax=Stylosanthes scabra TaxID=79078 RepID=A0ABU6R9F6_9FABA|nr:hypothetical protein [Stylosanthes scabra]
MSALLADASNTQVESKKRKKRRAKSDPDQNEAENGTLVDDEHDLNEPTMGEKLATLNLADDENKSKQDKLQESSDPAKPPSAASVHVLLKQALNAEDRTLLLDCLYTQDDKVIRKSIAQLNPSNVLKLLHSLISIIETRGAILACALPWLKCLLVQHASGIMSQESSLRALNSLYQLIESRVSTFTSTIQLLSCLDILFSGVIDAKEEEGEAAVPVIFEDNDDSEEEEESESDEGDAMETDRDNKHEGDRSDEEALDGDSDFEEIDDAMMGE